jgi:hypothetical protein
MSVAEADAVKSFETSISRIQRELVEELGFEALAWLTLPPIWTDELAAHAPFPLPRQGRQDFLDRCEMIGWCVRRPVPMASRREDAAEILTSLSEVLPTGVQETDSWQKLVQAAALAIDQIEISTLRRSLRKRLAARAGTSVALAHVPDVETSGEIETADPVERLIDRQAWTELQDLWSAARPAQLQRIVLRHLDELPDTLLKDAIELIADGAPRVAAGIIVSCLPRLSRSSAHNLAVGLEARVDRGQRGAEATIANLAVAVGYGNDNRLALELCDGLSDDRLRAQALGLVAGVVAHGPERSLTGDVVSRIARAVIEGEGVDLTGAADAVAQLAEANALEFATPIIEVVRQQLQHDQQLRRDRLGAADIGPLVRLAASLRAMGRDQAAWNIFVRQAIILANEKLAEPSAQAAGLTLLLPVLQGPDLDTYLGRTLSAAKRIADLTERARALSQLVMYLGAEQRDEVVNDIILALQPAEPGDAFWVPDGARSGILAELERRMQLPWLRGQAAAIGAAVGKLSSQCVMPPEMRRWAVLAATLTDKADEAGEIGDDAGQVLRDEVANLLESGLTADALGWIETGRRLLSVIRGEFDTSLLIAARKVERSRRTADDRRLLKRFLPRKEQIDAFKRLLEPRDEDSPWALHYLGAGGVGKTLLLRHIGAELAVTNDLIVTRVDFDHLNPDFPRRRPELLLLSFLEELEAHATPETRELYEEAEKVLKYQEKPPDSKYPTAVFQARDDAIRRFCAYLRALGRTVVLILDTCEELAKLESASAALPQLDAAFSLLEHIHEELPSVLVVLAGRRPLACQVHNGRLKPERRPHRGMPLKKSYMTVQEVTGFTEPEAREYLSEREGLTLDEGDIGQLLTRSHSGPDEPAYEHGRGPGQKRAISYVPFDLAQYAAALREDPNYLSTAPPDLAYATYVKDRIAGRLTPNALALLPAIVLMRRFNQDMLSESIAGLALRITSDEAWQELGSIEWISMHYDYDSKQRPGFMEVDRTMLERLQAFYAFDQRDEYDRARRQLARGLANIVRNRPLDDLTVDHVDAALRCLEPDDAARLCDALSLRVARANDIQIWMWAYLVFSRVRGPDGALGDPGHPATASATALHATALPPFKPGDDLRPEWQIVAATASNHPDPAVARWLAARGALLAEPTDTARWPDALLVLQQLVAGGLHRHAAWLAGTFLNVVSKATESASTQPELDAVAAQQDLLRELIGYQFAAHVRAVGSLLLARMLLITDDVPGAAEQFRLAIELTRAHPPAEVAAETAADGAIPGNLRDRVRLEAALANLPETAPVRQEWLNQALDAISASTGDDLPTDSDRLAALLLSQLLDEGPVSAGQLSHIQGAVGSLPPPPARTQTHAGIQPLRVVLSRAWLVLGDVSQARSTLGPRTFAEAPAEQWMLDLARVEIARRMRLPKSDPWVRRKLREARPPAEAPQVYEAMALLGEGGTRQPEAFRPSAHFHSWWRAETATSRIEFAELDNAFIVARQWCPPDQPYLAAALELDYVEHLRRANSRLVSWQSTKPLPPAELPRRWPPRSDEELWRLGLRKTALAWGDITAKFHDRLTGEQPGERLAMILPGRAQPGARRLAELALDEGELMALRVPEAGARLLQMALVWFNDASDPVGALIARTAKLLATVRATKRGPDPSEVGDLQATYQHARNEIPELPSWGCLQSEKDYTAALLTMPKPTVAAWEGWLLRLRWLLDGAPETWRGLDPKTTAIPPELVIRSQRGAAGQTPAGTSPGKSPVTRLAPPRLSVVGNVTILASAMGLTAILLALSVYNLIAAVGGLPVSWLLLATALIVAAAAIGFHIMTTGPHKSWAEVEIDPGPTPASVYVEITAFASKRWHLRSAEKPAKTRVQMIRPTVPDPQRTVIHERLDETASTGHRLPVSLLVARTLAGVSWESWLGVGLPDIDMYLERPYPLLLEDVRRTPPRPGDSVYWAMSPPRWSGLISRSLPTGQAKFPSDFPSALPGDVLVIVAVAISTDAGRRLVVHQGASRDDDLVIDPDEAALDGLTAIVLGEPRSSRSPTAQSAVALRTCAADLLEAGARTVIVVPNAPSIVASRVLASLTETLRPGVDLSLQELRTTVAGARDLLKEADPGLGYELTVMSRTVF